VVFEIFFNSFEKRINEITTMSSVKNIYSLNFIKAATKQMRAIWHLKKKSLIFVLVLGATSLAKKYIKGNIAMSKASVLLICIKRTHHTSTHKILFLK
jgi:hypothetical protein